MDPSSADIPGLPACYLRPPLLYCKTHCIPSHSKLSVCSLHWLLFVRRLQIDYLLVTSPVHSLQALCQDRVGVVEAGVKPIGIHARQVLDLQLDQRSTKLARISKLDGKSIYTTPLALVIRGVIRTTYQLHIPCDGSRCSRGA
jgi:hypothetical protein